jgi:hypothetical protein
MQQLPLRGMVGRSFHHMQSLHLPTSTLLVEVTTPRAVTMTMAVFQLRVLVVAIVHMQPQQQWKSTTTQPLQTLRNGAQNWYSLTGVGKLNHMLGGCVCACGHGLVVVVSWEKCGPSRRHWYSKHRMFVSTNRDETHTRHNTSSTRVHVKGGAGGQGNKNLRSSRGGDGGDVIIKADSGVSCLAAVATYGA